MQKTKRTCEFYFATLGNTHQSLLSIVLYVTVQVAWTCPVLFMKMSYCNSTSLVGVVLCRHKNVLTLCVKH